MYVELFKCKQCGRELGRGPSSIGTPFKVCRCGASVIVPNRVEWDYASVSVQREQRFMAAAAGIGAGALLGFAGYMAVGYFLMDIDDSALLANWPVYVAIIALIGAVLTVGFFWQLRKNIRRSRQRLLDPDYRAKYEAYRDSGVSSL